MMNSGAKKSVVWSDNETKVLIGLWKNHFIEMRKATRNVPIFKMISMELEKNGIVRTSKQVASKIDNLTQQYKRIHRRLRGTDPKPRTWKYYSELHSFLGDVVYSANKACLSEEDSRSVVGNCDIYPNPASDSEYCHTQTKFEMVKVDTTYEPVVAFNLNKGKKVKPQKNATKNIQSDNILEALNELIKMQKEFAKNYHLSQKIEQSLLREQTELQRQSVYTQQRLLELLEQNFEQEEKSS